MSDQMQKIVEALAAGLDAAKVELARTKEAFGYKEVYAARWRADEEDVALIESALAAARAMQDARPVLRIKDFDEYGPLLDWSVHWSDLRGQVLYTAPPPPAVSEGPQPAQKPVLWVYQFGDRLVTTPSAETAKHMSKVLSVTARPLIYGDTALPPPAALCPCKDRPSTECPGEWEQGCDLGANAEHARRVPEISEVNAESSRFANGEREVNASSDAKDAERWRTFRELTWDTSPVCAVADPKDAVKLGCDCPSRDRLEAMVDAIAAQQRGA
jgi:hypothetical protein